MMIEGKNEIYIHIPKGWEVKIENTDVIISPPQLPRGNPSDEDIVKKKDEHLHLQKIAQELYMRHYRLPNLNKNKKLQDLDYYHTFYELAKETGRSPREIAEEMLREAQEKNGRM